MSFLIRKTFSTSIMFGLRRAMSISHPDNELYNKIGFLGTGNMAQAIIQGLVNQKKYKPDQIYGVDNNQEYVEFIKQNGPTYMKNINFLESTEDMFNTTNVVILCVKPQDLKNTLKANKEFITPNHLLISIAAGIKIEQIENLLTCEARVLRLMPNTASRIQQGCSVYSKGKHATKSDSEFVNNLSKSIGTCEGEIKEELMDVVTALSGSGPAYMFVILDALADGAVKMGLNRQTALKLATQTMVGSANMVMKELNIGSSGKHIMQMKDEVCSLAGTAIAGVSELEKQNVRGSFIKCIEEATSRAKELSK